VVTTDSRHHLQVYPNQAGRMRPEDLFSTALERSDYEPLAKLAYHLRYADYYIANELATDKALNCYRKFFETFESSQFLTFNYDSLPETFLQRLGRWYPPDGYGCSNCSNGASRSRPAAPATPFWGPRATFGTLNSTCSWRCADRSPPNCC